MYLSKNKKFKFKSFWLQAQFLPNWGDRHYPLWRHYSTFPYTRRYKWSQNTINHCAWNALYSSIWIRNHWSYLPFIVFWLYLYSCVYFSNVTLFLHALEKSNKFWSSSVLNWSYLAIKSEYKRDSQWLAQSLTERWTIPAGETLKKRSEQKIATRSMPIAPTDKQQKFKNILKVLTSENGFISFMLTNLYEPLLL